MKSLIKAVAVVVAVVAPIAAFAQSNQPLTRAQVRADLDRVVAAGYNPLDWMHYPDNIQAAEAKVAAQSGSGYGPGEAGATQAGPGADAGMNSR